MRYSFQTATEVIGNMRTVVSLGREVTMHDRFMSHLQEPYKSAMKKCHVIGFAFGFSQACVYFVYAAAFSLGAYLIEKSEMDFQDVLLWDLPNATLSSKAFRFFGITIFKNFPIVVSISDTIIVHENENENVLILSAIPSKSS